MRLAMVSLLSVALLFAAAAMVGCASPSGSPSKAVRVVDGIEYTVEARVADLAPANVYISATLKNVTSRPVRLDFSGSCALTLEVFDSPDRKGSPIFDSAFWASVVDGTYSGCLGMGEVVKDLAPGESFTHPAFQVFVRSYEIVGHPLLGWTRPDGTYYPKATIRMNSRIIDGKPVYDRIAEVPTPDVLLRAAQPPLPTIRSINGVSFYVETSPKDTPTSKVTATLTATNTTEKAVQLYIGRDCPVSIAGYTSASRRDASYVLDKPDWIAGRTCTGGRKALDLAPGEVRTFTAEFDASPRLRYGPPWGIAPGRFFLAAGADV